MNSDHKLILKRMGVMNITPNSFSEHLLQTPETFETRLKQFGSIDILDVGAESTAPMNKSIDHQLEWSRLEPFLPQFKKFPGILSLDTYHPETIFKLCRIWKDEHHAGTLVWNDVSGKLDDSVWDYLRGGERFHYVYCHNLAPTRELSGRHMDYLSSLSDISFLEELGSYLTKGIHPRIILDPCLGFSKTYEQNWLVMEHMGKLQKLVKHHRWLIGFSRKSFLRQKFSLTVDDREKLDQIHGQLWAQMKPHLLGEVWIRTHRPELLPL